MAEPYLIKKYSSRRLYDVAAGHFVTLDDVDQLIRNSHHIRVVDAKGRDITRNLLLQILTEREEGGEPLLSVDLLHEIVRVYGNVMHGPFGRYLENGVALLREQREAWQRTLPGIFEDTAANATAAARDMLERQMSLWLRSQDAFMGVFGDASRPARRGQSRRSGKDEDGPRD